jgi:sugar transferase (PEP-CTERM/EpsH1 system associated)
MSVHHEPVHPNSCEDLRKYCATVELFKINPQFSRLRSGFHLLTRNPLTLPAFYSGRLRRSIKEKLRTEKFDLIYIYSSSMAQYILGAKDIPKLMDFIDVDSEKWFDYATRAPQPMRAVYFREGIRLRAFERKVAAMCERAIFASKKELNLFKRVAPNVASLALPNGVDLDHGPCLSYHENNLVFVGWMDYLPNIDAMVYFTNEILPLIRKEISEVKVFIVGGNPSRQVLALRQSANVIVTGSVKDIKPYLNDATASVIPLRIARGIQNKILEAMAHGVPVITTSAALEGIEARPGTDVLIGDDPQAFAKMTVAVLKDKNLRRTLSANALTVVRKNYNWERNLSNLNELITSVCPQ